MCSAVNIPNSFVLFSVSSVALCPQVIAIVMDMFTDVDILHDILNAAMRNVAVYILLDAQNAHHFINMLSNCRVNLQTIQVSTLCFMDSSPRSLFSGFSFFVFILEII